MNERKKNLAHTKSISLETKKLLRALAKKYETKNFLLGDPSCILYRYKNLRDTEIASFIMALLAFGKREQFLKKAETIFSLMKDEPFHWIKNGNWQNDFSHSEKKFYRFFSFDDVRDVFFAIQKILEVEKTFGDAVRKKYESAKQTQKNILLSQVIAEFFPNCKMVSRTKNSSAKRLNLFAKWMVRDNSCVDLGAWKWFPKSALVIPLDTHVLAEAKKLKLISENKLANLQTALELTEKLKEVWKADPCKGDFALFGSGVNS